MSAVHPRDRSPAGFPSDHRSMILFAGERTMLTPKVKETKRGSAHTKAAQAVNTAPAEATKG
jgi:hypothetical protein